MQANLGLMFERKAKISCNGGRSVTNNLRARQDYMRTLGKQTSAGLKITSADVTYPGQRLSFPLYPIIFSWCDSYFFAKYDKCYYKVRQVLQSATIITKCVRTVGLIKY